MSNFNKKLWNSLVMALVAASTIPGILSAAPYQAHQPQDHQIAQRDRDYSRISPYNYSSDRDWDRRQYYQFDSQYYQTPGVYGNYNYDYNNPNYYYNYPSDYYNNPRYTPGVNSNYNYNFGR